VWLTVRVQRTKVRVYNLIGGKLSLTFCILDLNDRDGDRRRLWTDLAAGIIEYEIHVENNDVDSAGLLKKHTAHTDQQRLAVYFVRQHSENRVVLGFLLPDLLL